MTSNEVLTKKNGTFSTLDLALTAMFSVLIAVCSWISVPLTVPVTLQTFAVFCTLGMLGGKRGFFAVLVYIMLGMVGVPVFSGFKGGAAVLFGVTGGYIVGFLLMAAVYWAAEKAIKNNTALKIGMMAVGLIICYTFGTAWFVAVYTKNVGAITVFKALKLCVLPFLAWDGLKLAAATLLCGMLNKRVKL